MAYDLQDVAYAIMYWSLSMVLLGITFTLIGVIYLKREQTTLIRLISLSFIIIGFLCIAVGYIGGFTLLPWFSVYDFPWVTTTAIVPCLLTLTHLNMKIQG